MLGRFRAAILWSILILVICLMPSGTVPGLGLFSRFHLDKVVHAILYGVLAFLLVKAFAIDGRPLRKGTLIFAVLVSIAYGAAIELLQEIPILRRSAEWGDLLADAGGAILGAAMARWGAERAAHF